MRLPSNDGPARQTRSATRPPASFEHHAKGLHRGQESGEPLGVSWTCDLGNVSDNAYHRLEVPFHPSLGHSAIQTAAAAFSRWPAWHASSDSPRDQPCHQRPIRASAAAAASGRHGRQDQHRQTFGTKFATTNTTLGTELRQILTFAPRVACPGALSPPPRTLDLAMRTLRSITTVFGVVALIAAVALLVARYVPVVNHPSMMVTLAAPFAIVAAPMALLLSAIARRWRLSALAAVATVMAAAVAAPGFVAATAPQGTAVRVMSLNMKYGGADAREAVALARDGVDVLAVQEMTPEAVTALSAAGLDELLPHRYLDPRPEANGVGLWSRYLMMDQQPITDFRLPAVAARLEIPGVTTRPVVASVHLSPPWPMPVEEWRHDVARLPATLTRLADTAGDAAVLIAGDFNSTTDMAQFRNALPDDYHDAADQAGAPFRLTYPADRFRPVIAIDHVLTRGAVATGVETARIVDTDHMAVVADVTIPAQR